jgi:4-amino-4-deoxy-L-arabinose transferase-like glycosyltransferase
VSRKKPHAATAVLIVAIGVVYAVTFRPGQDWGDDFAAYINNARNIVEGLPYGATTYVPNPTYPFLPSITPPGFPLLLAPVYRLFGLNLNAMKVEGLFFLLVALWLVATVFARDLPRSSRWLLVIALAFHPLVWDLKDRILSDVPFLVFVLLALCQIERLDRDENRNQADYVGEGVAGVVMFAAVLTRQLGIVLPSALLLRDLLYSRRVSARTLRILATFGALVMLQVVLVPPDRATVERLPGSLAAVLQNARSFAAASSALWSVGDMRLLNVLAAYVVGGAAALGVAIRFRTTDGASVLEYVFVLYVLALMCFTAHMHVRYLLPLLPLLLYYSIVGMTAARKWRRWTGNAVLAAWIAAVASIAMTSIGAYEAQAVAPRVDSPTATEMLQHVRQRTTQSDLIVFGHPRALALLSGRRTTLFYPDTDANVFAFWERIGASYLLAGPPGAETGEMVALLRRHPHRFVLEWSNPEFRLYRLSRRDS